VNIYLKVTKENAVGHLITSDPKTKLNWMQTLNLIMADFAPGQYFNNIVQQNWFLKKMQSVIKFSCVIKFLLLSFLNTN
jgi:hypothetical protein